MPHKYLFIALLLVALAGCTVETAPSPTLEASSPAVATPNPAALAIATPSATATPMPTATLTSTPSPTPSRTPPPTATPAPSATPLPTADRPASSPLERQQLGRCELVRQTSQNVARVMKVNCQLPEGVAVYAAIDGKVQVSGSGLWRQVNIFYPNAADGFLIYFLHGDWNIVVAQNAHVREGDLLAIARQPVSDAQGPSLALARGRLAPVGYENIELPPEIVGVWTQ